MRIFLLSCAFVLLLAASAGASKPIPADQISAPQALLPYCSWLPDPGGRHSIDSITSRETQQGFSPLPDGFPLEGKGPLWLRMVIIKKQSGLSGGPAAPEASRLSVSLGALPPGETTVYMSKAPGQLGGEGGWHAERVLPHEVIDLPDPGLLPVSVYIRMDETPGLWFTPAISAKNAVRPDVLPSEFILPGLFIAACAACLLRALSERAGWALWSSLFLLCALAQTLLPMPGPSHGFRPEHLPALLAPGMSLILLPHIGRCMFRASYPPSWQDPILYLCSFIGAAVALGPLFPGFAWLTKLFPLWPLLILPLLPVCVSALSARHPGALSFTAICVMPLLGTGVSLYALFNTSFIHPLAVQGSLWGLAVGGLGLVLARVPSGNRTGERAKNADAQVLTGLTLAESAADAARHQAADSGQRLVETSAFTRQSQYDELLPLEVVPLDQAVAPAPGLPDLPMPGEPSLTSRAAALPPLSTFDPAARPDLEASPQAWEDAPLNFPPQERERTELAEHPAALSIAPETAAAQEDFPPTPRNDCASPSLSLAERGEDGDQAEDIPPPSSELAWFARLGVPLAAPKQDAPAQAAPDSAEEPDFSAAPMPEPLPAPAGSGCEQQAVLPAATEDTLIPGVEETGPQLPASPEGAPADGPPLPAESRDETGPDRELAPECPEPVEEHVIPLLDDELYPLSMELQEMEEEAARQTSFATENGFLFSLHSLVREVHTIVAPLAKNRGLVFSWYISPLLPSLLEGDTPRLRGALTLLLQNAVLATRKGAVRLAVRKNPGSADPGDLLFVINDNGSAQRTEAGFFHAWEMAARTGGIFNVEYSPSGGTQISFTARFALPSEQMAGDMLELTADPSSTFAVASDDDDEPMPVLNTILSPAGEAWSPPAAPETEVFEEAYRLAGLTPEQMSAGREFLEPLPVLEADEALLAELQASGGALASFFPATGTGQTAPEREDGVARQPESISGLEAPPLAQPAAGRPLQEPAAPDLPDFPANIHDPSSGMRRIVAAEMTTSTRRLLSHYLADLPHEHIQATVNAQVIDIVRAGPVSLIIFDGDAPEHDIIRALRDIRSEERAGGRTGALVLALTSHQGQSDRLLENGATHALVKPVRREDIFAVAAAAPPVQIPPAALDGDPPLTDAPASAPSEEPSQTSPFTPRPDELQAAPPAASPFSGDAAARAADKHGPVEDLLTAALRDAPQQQGTPQEVSLPPRHGVGTAQEAAQAREETRQHLAAAEAQAPAAPLLLTLSLEDITPASPAREKHENRHAATPAPGSLLDFALPDFFPATDVQEQDAPVQDATTQEEQSAPEPERDAPAALPTPEAETAEPEGGEPELPESAADTGQDCEPEPAAQTGMEPGHADTAQSGGTPAEEHEESHSPSQSFPLPGLDNETLDASLLPLTPGLIYSLRDGMHEIGHAAGDDKSILVQDAAGRLAGKAEAFGLIKLGKIARCVERAAEADDMEAVHTLLEDLLPVISRYMQSLQECFDAFLGRDR